MKDSLDNVTLQLNDKYVGCCKQAGTPSDNAECEVVEGHGGGLHQLAHLDREHLDTQVAGDGEHCADLETNTDNYYKDTKA